MRHTLTMSLLILVAAAAALAPVLALRWALHSHALARAQEGLFGAVERTIQHVDAVLAEATDALAAGASMARVGTGCPAEVRERLSGLVHQATWLRTLYVLDDAGGVRCGSSELPSALPRLVFRPARAAHLAVAVVDQGEQRAALAVRWVNGQVALVAMIAIEAHRHDAFPLEWRAAAIGLLTLDDDTLIGRLPAAGEDFQTRLDATPARLLTITLRSERFPIRFTASVPEMSAIASMGPLTTLVDVGGGLLGFVFLALVVQAARRPVSLDDALRQGVRRDEFVPFYQPVFAIQTGRLVGCEVLIRWRRRDGTMVPPGAFIQRAEESGLAVAMTQQLMRKTRNEIGALYADRPSLKLAFNLFADHFSDLSTLEDVREIFRAGGVRYTQLVFEVTERYPLPNLNRAKVAISGLQDLGCRVALDDAGTGHGGLAYLQKLGMDQIKIDKLFVDTIDEKSASAPIVDSLTDLARSLGMEIVAEGVETEAQLAYLKLRGVDCAQGFLFAKPLPGRDYIALVEALVPPETAAASAPRLAKAAA